MISLGNSRSFLRIISLFQLLLKFCSLQTFIDIFLYHGLGEVYHILTQNQAHPILVIIHWRTLRDLLSVYIFFLVSIFCISFPRMVLNPSCSFCQKGTLVILVCQTLWYFGLMLFSHTMLPFMGVVDCSTTSPFSLTNFSPWDLERLIISTKGVWVI
jgi:hypothetical protein